jgi:hypothetical protein
VLLDDREAAARLGDDEQTPEERPALDGVRDPDVQRLLEDDVARHVDEQSVLPQGRVVRGELLVPAHERVQQGVIVRQPLEADAGGRVLDLETSFSRVCHTGGIDVEHRR